MNKECQRCERRGPGIKMCQTWRGNTEAYHGYRPGQLCRRCHADLIPDPELLYPQLLDDEFEFFYAAASGTSRKILKTIEESNVLVSYLTRNSGRLGTEKQHFVDCGGNPGTFQNQAGDGTPTYPDSHEDYVQYVVDTTTSADRWALRDYPVTDSVREKFDITTEGLQRLTTDAHRELLDLAQDSGIKSTPVTAIQGDTVRDYLHHLDQLEAAGALTDTVAIGSIAFASPEFKQEVICAIREALSPAHSIHGFGVSLKTLQKDGVIEALSSADSGGWLSQEANTDHPAWDDDVAQGLRPSLYEYLQYTERLGELISASQSAANTQQEGSGSLEQFLPETDTNPQTECLSSKVQRAVNDYKQGELATKTPEMRHGSETQADVSEFTPDASAD